MPRQFHHADALQALNNMYIITSQNRYVCLVLEFGTLTGAHIGIMFACRLPKGALMTTLAEEVDTHTSVCFENRILLAVVFLIVYDPGIQDCQPWSKRAAHLNGRC